MGTRMSYDMTCEIKRFKGYDDLDVTYESLYSGECDYQEKNTSKVSGQVYQTTPTLYLPENEVLFLEGDIVTIIATKGRVINAVVDVPRDMDGRVIKGTKITLKQASNG